MPAIKEIRTKINSIQSTQKITRAMEMVAASKMKKAQLRMRKSRPYSEKIRQVIAHLANANAYEKHPFLTSRMEKRVALVLVSSDRGLCGGLNVNLFRFVKNWADSLLTRDVSLSASLIGSKGLSFIKYLGCPLLSHIEKIGDNPSVEDIWPAINVLIHSFLNDEVDAVYLAFNRFQGAMVQQPALVPVLPLSGVALETSDTQNGAWDYLYEPNAMTLLEQLVQRFIEVQLYQAVVENLACEQASRMIAMKSASDSAKNLISDLKLVYNKARQAAITQEISEIVGGAAAV